MIPAPNFTQVPNLFFDSLMSDLSDSELRVFLAIIRKTFGWSKTKDRISLTQLSEMTGMARSAVIYGLNGRVDKNGREVIKGLIPRGLVLCFESSKGNEYMVHVEDQSESKLVLMEDHASPHGGPELVLMEDTQKKSSKETIQKKNIAIRHKHGVYQHVLLTDAELEHLKADFPTTWETMIRNCDEYCQRFGKKYNDYNLTMRNWARKDIQSSPAPQVQQYQMTDLDRRLLELAQR